MVESIAELNLPPDSGFMVLYRAVIDAGFTDFDSIVVNLDKHAIYYRKRCVASEENLRQFMSNAGVKRYSGVLTPVEATHVMHMLNEEWLTASTGQCNEEYTFGDKPPRSMRRLFRAIVGPTKSEVRFWLHIFIVCCYFDGVFASNFANNFFIKVSDPPMVLYRSWLVA